MSLAKLRCDMCAFVLGALYLVLSTKLQVQSTNHVLRFGVACPHDGLDISADVEVALDFDAEGIAGGDEVFEDDVDYVLVEDFDVAERIYVELQTL